MNAVFVHISRLLIFLLCAGPVLRTAHFLLEVHSDFYEVGDFQIEQKNIRHWCEHFIHAEYKGLLPAYDRQDLFRNISERKKKLFGAGISQIVAANINFYVRGPPEHFN